ncbi:hypothetical protein H0H87_001176 [Tephrocybe sp. NHM501043]|nr:hypothetical protein H0H87_001176 [Tephrocybe sp. NHM501043]
MRRTGKLYGLTLASSGLTVLASILIVLWNENSSPFHLYLDLVPQGFGMASFITSTLIAMIAGVYKEDMAVATGKIIPQLEATVRRAAVESYADALRVVFICQVAINVLGFIACLPIQENVLP